MALTTVAPETDDARAARSVLSEVVVPATEMAVPRGRATESAAVTAELKARALVSAPLAFEDAVPATAEDDEIAAVIPTASVLAAVIPAVAESAEVIRPVSASVDPEMALDAEMAVERGAVSTFEAAKTTAPDTPVVSVAWVVLVVANADDVEMLALIETVLDTEPATTEDAELVSERAVDSRLEAAIALLADS